MKLPTSPFTVTDGSRVPATTYPGESGEAIWRTQNIGDLRVRMVEYSPGYLADHWCDRGHVLYVVEGELDTELRDGRKFKLSPGMS
jgi:quercetin dioxygenase-like cupin family protein